MSLITTLAGQWLPMLIFPATWVLGPTLRITVIRDFGLNSCYFFAVKLDERIEILVKAFTSRRLEIDAAWLVADSMGDDLLLLFAEAFPRIRESEGCAAIVRYVDRFSRESEVAFRMGTVAVRDSACQSAIMDALCWRSRRTLEDARAAIDAIKSKNHNFFKVRDHSGKFSGLSHRSEFVTSHSGSNTKLAAHLVNQPVPAGIVCCI